MANRFYGYDIINKLLSMAQDATYGVNAQIAAINSERSLTGNDACPTIKSFTKFFNKRNALPELFVRVASSEVENEDDVIGGAGDNVTRTRNVDKTPETYSFDVMIFHKDNSDNLPLYMEMFLEAIYRTYHLYCDADILMILATSSIRDDVNSFENQTMKMAGFTFSLFINIS